MSRLNTLWWTSRLGMAAIHDYRMVLKRRGRAVHVVGVQNPKLAVQQLRTLIANLEDVAALIERHYMKGRYR